MVMTERVAAKFKSLVREGLAASGYEVRPLIPRDIPVENRDLFRELRAYTLTSPERFSATCDAVRYVARASVPGAVVECGVWAGGGMMAAARILMAQGDVSRDLYLFDTFEGMSEPSELDLDASGRDAENHLDGVQPAADNAYCYVALEQVERNMQLVGYPSARVHFIKGPVEETVPASAPPAIAVLRLDTDWYESTKHELDHLVPRMSPGGVLLIDDYGHWQGARRAVDEWLNEQPTPLLMARTDNTGRLILLPH